MICPSCSHENPDAAKFCSECAAPLVQEVPCAACGSANAPGSKFCNECAQPLAAAAATPTPRPSTPAPSPALPSSFAGGRYQVKGFLGEGSRKRVYLVNDTRLDRDVAFSVIKTEGLDADGLVRVRREAQAMGRLGDHPHIVTVYDTGEDDGQTFIVSQYMPGGSIDDLLARTDSHRLAIDEAMRFGEQVCRALEHAHSRGIVHRDLKPGNVWLTADPLASGARADAQLGDFGLAVALDRSRMTMAGMMIGTVAYMAPEQALGRPPDARSDLYALGAMLYEMVAGRPPFLGDDAIGVISQHINTAAVVPSWHNPQVPKPLDALIMRLLAKPPEERPGNAGEVAAELRRVLSRSTEEPAAQPQQQVVTDLRNLSWGRFIGRHDEMEQLKSSLEAALSGRPAMAMVAGEPGIGKTRLAEEFAVYAGLRGAQMITGRSYEGEASIPYRPFIEALRQYVRSRPDPELREELGPGAPEVATLVSEIRQRFADIPESPKLEPEAERVRLFDSVTQFLKGASRSQPLVLLLDDLHWADKPSLLMLQHVARHSSGERLMLLATYRDVELDRTHPLSAALTELRRTAGFRRVILRGLPAEEVEEMLAALDPSQEGAPGRQILAGALYRETEGNPFFIREVLAHLVETGKIVREGGRWVGRVQNVSELGIPEGVREVIGRRLSRLSEGCNRMLTRASAMTRGFTWDALKAICDEPESELLEYLEEALAAQLLAERREVPGTYDFTHALIRQTLYGELSTPRRVIHHREIGEALEKLYSGNLDVWVGELAHHFYQAAPGGDVDKAIDYARRAGDRAAAMMAHEDAAGQYGLALQAMELRKAPDDRLRCELLLALGSAEVRAGDPEKAAATLLRSFEIAERLGDPQLIGVVALAYGEAMGRGPLMLTDAGAEIVERALTAQPEGDTVLRGDLLLTLAFRRLQPSQPVEDMAEMAREARATGERLGDPELQVRALNGLHFMSSGPQFARERAAMAAEATALTAGSSTGSDILNAHMHQMVDALELGDIETVDRELAILFPLAEQTRDPWFLSAVPFWGAMRAIMQGHLEEGEQKAQQGFAIGQRFQNPLILSNFGIQMFTNPHPWE